MSAHGDIRAAARALVQDAGWPAGFPFQETINTRQSKTALNAIDGWTSLRFDFAQADQIEASNGGTTREEGMFTIMLMTRAGSGDSAVMTAWGTIQPIIEARTWNPSTAHSFRPNPPVAEQESPDHLWQRWDIAVEYLIDY